MTTRGSVLSSAGLLELVSAPHVGFAAVEAEMRRLHGFVAQNLPAAEMFWAPSMPPPSSEAQIRIADFGSSPTGRMKEVYRQGLASRYGKIMQIISGVHFNFSFDQRFIDQMHVQLGSGLAEQECRNRMYFRLIRGFDQHAWLLPYLFGASPVAARSSVSQPTSWLRKLDDEHVFGEHATSLRMSDIGYQSPAQSDLNISHRSVEDYVRELVLATRTSWPEYTAMGIRNGDDWVQLNGNILQIENEYYSAIRPKQITERGERPACALFSRGVNYIEVRMLDVDPFEPMGIASSTGAFMEVFLLACLAWGEDEPGREQADKHNRTLAIRHGRQPDLELMRDTRSISLRAWADECLDDCAGIALQLDSAHGDNRYSLAVQQQRDKWRSPESLPSQRVLDESADDYHAWACAQSRQYTTQLAQQPPDSALLGSIAGSFVAAAKLEADAQISLEDYVAEYYASLCDQKLESLL